MKAAYLIFAINFLFACASKHNNAEVFAVNGVAIRGYDAVAFYSDHKAIPGSSAYEYKWNGASWHFANKIHLDSFSANPVKYAPQYGGYCAYGTAEGHKAPTLPETWTISQGKLYFNYNNEVKQLWMNDQQGFINKADKLWPTVKDDEF